MKKTELKYLNNLPVLTLENIKVGSIITIHSRFNPEVVLKIDCDDREQVYSVPIINNGSYYSSRGWIVGIDLCYWKVVCV